MKLNFSADKKKMKFHTIKLLDTETKKKDATVAVLVWMISYRDMYATVPVTHCSNSIIANHDAPRKENDSANILCWSAADVVGGPWACYGRIVVIGVILLGEAAMHGPGRNAWPMGLWLQSFFHVTKDKIFF